MKTIKKGRTFHYEGEYIAKKEMDTETFADEVAISFKRCGLVIEIQGGVTVNKISKGMFDTKYSVGFDATAHVDMSDAQIIDIVSNQIMLSSRYLIGRNNGTIRLN